MSQIDEFLGGASASPSSVGGDIDSFLGPSAPKRTWGEALKDTGAQLAEGVNTAVGAVPDLVAPDSGASKFFRDNAEFWRDQQSDPLKQRIAGSTMRAKANRGDLQGACRENPRWNRGTVAGVSTVLPGLQMRGDSNGEICAEWRVSP